MSRMYGPLSAFAVLALSACATEPAPVVRYSGDSQSLALREAREIEAAKRHPNAQPRERPQYPEQAPPPLAAGATLPAPIYITRRSAPYPNYPATTSSVEVEREIYAGRPYRSGGRYGFGLSYGYGYPYGGRYWEPYAYGYYPSSYRFGYGLGLGVGAWGTYRGGYSSGFGHSHSYRLSAPRYNFGSSFGGGGHVRSVGGGSRHHH